MARRTSSASAPSSKTFDTLIVGAGPAGQLLALSLAARGMRVALIDRADPAAAFKGPKAANAPKDYRTLALAALAVDLLKELGLWDALAPHANPIRFIRCVEQDKPGILDFDTREIGGEPFGMMVANLEIRRVLYDAVEGSANITTFFGATPRGIRADARRALIDLGSVTLEAPLLVAADGKNSWCRAQLGIEVWRKPYETSALVTTLGHTRAHNDVALEHFMPQGPFALLPMKGNFSGVVWTETPERAAALAAMSEEDFLKALRPLAGDYLGELVVMAPRQVWPLELLHAKTYRAPRMLLLGDAAHTIHPIAGQGLNLTLRDIKALTGMIVEAQSLGLDIGHEALLARYERSRRRDNWAMIGVTHGLERLFKPDLPALSLVRRFGLAAVNEIGPMRRFLMKRAMGK